MKRKTNKQKWLMGQTWNDLLFAHYPVPAEEIRPLIPDCLALDTFGGQAWISVVPFEMNHIYFRGLSLFTYKRRFAELNVRTYVTFNGEAGIYFFSLDANSPLAVKLANFSYALPYLHADMSVVHSENRIHFKSSRTDTRAPFGDFDGVYGANGDPFRTVKGSLEFWLTERYALFVLKGRKILKGAIYHDQWTLQPAYAEFKVNRVAESAGILLSPKPELLHFAKHLKVHVWPPEQVGIFDRES
ncbi:YqjF family protein [Jeotgalibacillus aurantiacus]|uniref:YqjF family protein n=1 Tax=Jeotgalibacillus aurantiacus TaxID=2763266 RepID=UPI001D0B7826|nr:DUF2071 domain-containing protein [Jeotgalibacillus aurantiacus]